MLLKNDGVSIVSGICQLGAQSDRNLHQALYGESYQLRAEPGNMFLDGSLKYRATEKLWSFPPTQFLTRNQGFSVCACQATLNHESSSWDWLSQFSLGTDHEVWVHGVQSGTSFQQAARSG